MSDESTLNSPATRLSPLEAAYYTGFLASAVVCFSPLKLAAYFVPAGFLAYLLWKAPGLILRNRAVIVGWLLPVVGLFYQVSSEEFLWTHYLLSWVTYSAFLPILLVNTNELRASRLHQRILKTVAAFLLVEGAYGIVQAVYGATQTGSFGGANGDYVEGTLHPSLDAELAMGNPMFAINLALMIIACLGLPRLFSGRRRTALILGSIALVLASVLHVLIFLVASLVIAWLLVRIASQRNRGSSSKSVASVLILIVGVTYLALPKDIANVGSYAEEVVDIETPEIPRAVMLYRVWYELPMDAPQQPWIGLGPGQFSSRASLLASGLYLSKSGGGRSIPLIPPDSTALAAEYCISLLLAFAVLETGEVGSTQQPFFSVLAVYTEMGALGLLLVLLLLIRLILRALRTTASNPSKRFEGVSFVTGTIFVALLGLQENYWEVPQAIFIGLLLLKVQFARLTAEPETE